MPPRRGRGSRATSTRSNEEPPKVHLHDLAPEILQTIFKHVMSDTEWNEAVDLLTLSRRLITPAQLGMVRNISGLPIRNLSRLSLFLARHPSRALAVGKLGVRLVEPDIDPHEAATISRALVMAISLVPRLRHLAVFISPAWPRLGFDHGELMASLAFLSELASLEVIEYGERSFYLDEALNMVDRGRAPLRRLAWNAQCAKDQLSGSEGWRRVIRGTTDLELVCEGGDERVVEVLACALSVGRLALECHGMNPPSASLVATLRAMGSRLQHLRVSHDSDEDNNPFSSLVSDCISAFVDLKSLQTLRGCVGWSAIMRLPSTLESIIMQSPPMRVLEMLSTFLWLRGLNMVYICFGTCRLHILFRQRR